jgi:hypothetical protein
VAARGGTLVSYGTASTRDMPGNPRTPVPKPAAALRYTESGEIAGKVILEPQP